jgi:uncharacterized protein YdeI (YjbR/CyaY-like superfamily)
MSREPAESVEVTSRTAWRTWLRRNHRRTDGIWVISYKKQVADRYVGYEALVEEALCFGWVDSKGRGIDDRRTSLWFAPRRPGSGWSRSNKDRVARLIADERMTAAGLAKIEAAKRDGSWTALDASAALAVPPDLAAALAKRPRAAANFDRFPPSVRRAILAWIGGARQAATRARRIEETATCAARNERVYGPAGTTKRPAGAVAPPGRKSKQD